MLAPTFEEATLLKAELERFLIDQPPLSIGTALEEFIEVKRQQGLRENTIKHLTTSLRLFLPVERALDRLTSEQAQRLYEKEQQRITRSGRPVSMATQHMVLCWAKSFFRWTVERGYLSASPFDKVKRVGLAKAGKPQLRLDEARKLKALLEQRAEDGDKVALALLMQLLLGLRSGEVLSRLVRDLDDDGRILLIPAGKTPNARRRLKIPDPLRPLLLRHVEGKPLEHWLFASSRGQPYVRSCLWTRLHVFCKQAGLPRVCPHSLRGLHSTLALEAGMTGDAVASALGHSSFRITARHYADQDTLVNTRVRRVSEALDDPR